MKFALVSDIHGNLAALEAVFADAKEEGVDGVFNLGDSFSGPLLPLQTAQFLMNENCISIAGNHERQLLASKGDDDQDSDAYAFAQMSEKELDWIRSLKPNAWIGNEIFLCHGTPTSDHEYYLESVDRHGLRAATLDEVAARTHDNKAEMIACGHSHISRSVRVSVSQWIVNPGSVGLQAYRDNHIYPHRVENNSPDARYAVIRKRSGVWNVSLKSVPYNFSSMAQLAKLRKRHDWEYALLTGSNLKDA